MKIDGFKVVPISVVPYMWLIVTVMLFITGYFLTFKETINLQEVVATFQWNVLIIAISMAIFTSLVASTGFMNQVAVAGANWSKGDPLRIVALYSFLLFGLSAFLNNLTATLVIMPALFVLLRGMQLNQAYVASLFSLLLAIGNCAGASTPIGDFPAIVIMSSGITTFWDYLKLAFPLFLTTGVILIVFHLLVVAKKLPKMDEKSRLERTLGVTFLAVQHKHQSVNKRDLYFFTLIFVCMFLAWASVPAKIVPPEIIAVTGVCIAASFAIIRRESTGVDHFDLKPFLLIASFLFIAGIVNNTGLLSTIANVLVEKISDPSLLLLVVMILTAVLTGIISAGPAAAAMMPVIQSLANGPFANQSDWLAIAFAASVCAGSSLFYWSATAGFMLADQVNKASLRDSEHNHTLSWGLAPYFKYGLIHFFIQLVVGITWVFVGINLSS